VLYFCFLPCCPKQTWLIAIWNLLGRIIDELSTKLAWCAQTDPPPEVMTGCWVCNSDLRLYGSVCTVLDLAQMHLSLSTASTPSSLRPKVNIVSCFASHNTFCKLMTNFHFPTHPPCHKHVQDTFSQLWLISSQLPVLQWGNVGFATPSCPNLTCACMTQHGPGSVETPTALDCVCCSCSNLPAFFTHADAAFIDREFWCCGQELWPCQG